MYLYVTTEATTGGYTGRVYTQGSGTSTTQVTIPTGISGANSRPCMVPYRGNVYVVGGFSRPLVYTRFGTLHEAGIPAPNTAPTLAASGTGITASVIGYLTYVHKIGDVVMQESNLSAASQTLSLTNQGIAWSALPTTCPNARVTHIRGYRSVDGATPRLAWERTLGTTSVTDTMSTTVLANRTSAPVFEDGTVDVGARGVPPAASFAVMWHDRMWYVAPNSPGVFFSKLYEPESVDVDSYIPTRDGEQPTGLGVLDDSLVVFYDTGCYSISGWGIADFNMEKVSTSLGCVSHHSIVNIQNTLFFASQQGVCGYSGSKPVNLMARSKREDWIADYEANPLAFENSAGADDMNGNYLLLTVRTSSPKTIIYVGHYRAMTEEGSLEPYWTIDKRTREDYALGMLKATGQKRGKLAFASCDGYVRQEDATDDDDDSDSYAKKLTIRTPHFFMGDQGGSVTHGRKYKALDLFVKNPNDAVVVKCFGGDDEAATAAAPQQTYTHPAVANTAYASQTSFYVPLNTVAGKGLTIQYEVTSPVGFEYRGENVYFDDGVQSKAAK
jgi:hypothetical protein